MPSPGWFLKGSLTFRSFSSSLKRCEPAGNHWYYQNGLVHGQCSRTPAAASVTPTTHSLPHTGDAYCKDQIDCVDTKLFTFLSQTCL